MVDQVTLGKWTRRGFVAIFWAAIIFVFVVIYEFEVGKMVQGTANFYIGVGSIIATLILASVIYFQSYQNENLIKKSEEQSLVLQESEWMPETIPQFNDYRLKFNTNRPWRPEVKVVGGDSDIDWIKHEVTPIGSLGSYDWDLPLNDKIIDELKSVKEEDYEVEVHLKYESQTGEKYQEIYRLKGRIDENENAVIHWAIAERRLPWDDSGGVK